MKASWGRTAGAAVVLVASFTSGASAQGEERVLRLTPAEIIWTAGPQMLPPGASMAVIEGAFPKPGPFTVRLKFPANYRIPPH